jgi:predicted RNase H-related nuclease YkuK (DUF458 family)
LLLIQKIKQLELSIIIGINIRNIRKNTSQLKVLGIISRIESDKGERWGIIKNKKINHIGTLKSLCVLCVEF